MNLTQFKPFKENSFYDDSSDNQIFENVPRRKTSPYCTVILIMDFKLPGTSSLETDP